MTSSFKLSHRASFWVSAGVVVHTLWVSAAPTLTYPLYAAEWSLTPFVTTAIFAIYPIVVVLGLVLFGDVSDHIGHRKTMLWGLSASLVGVLLFAVAPSISWILIGRAFMGMGVGLCAGPAAAALVDYSGRGGRALASSITTVGQAAGIGLAAFIGGALIQYGPFPTRLNFWVLAVVIFLLICLTWLMPEADKPDHKRGWKLRPIVVPTGTGGVFPTSAIGATIAYVIGALVLSLGAQTARELIGSSNVFVNGLAITLYAVVWGVCGFVSRKLVPTTSLVWGSIVTIVSMGLLILSVADRSLDVFLIAVGSAGGASSLLVLGGLHLVSAHSAPSRRSGTLSFLFLIAYVLQGAVAFILGWAATRWDLKTALNGGSVFVILMGLTTLICVKAISGKVAEQTKVASAE